MNNDETETWEIANLHQEARKRLAFIDLELGRRDYKEAYKDAVNLCEALRALAYDGEYAHEVN